MALSTTGIQRVAAGLLIGLLALAAGCGGDEPPVDRKLAIIGLDAADWIPIDALIEQGRYQEAIEAYKKTLELDPQDRDAKHNLELVRAKLKEMADKEQQQQDQQQQQEKIEPSESAESQTNQ